MKLFLVIAYVLVGLVYQGTAEHILQQQCGYEATWASSFAGSVTWPVAIGDLLARASFAGDDYQPTTPCNRPVAQ